jgi:hypothetical protein
VLERRSGRVLAAFLAHLLIRQVGWSIRRHPAEAAAGLVGDGLELSETFAQ